MEREPEKDHDPEYGEQSQKTAFHFRYFHFGYFGFRIVFCGNAVFFNIRQSVPGHQEDYQGNDHGNNGNKEGIMESGVENVQVTIGKGSQICHGALIGFGGRQGEFFHGFTGDFVGTELMAKSRQLGIISQTV